MNNNDEEILATKHYRIEIKIMIDEIIFNLMNLFDRLHNV